MKNLRKALYFTQQEFAALSGVSIPTICQCEKGNRYASKPDKMITEIQLALLQPEPLRAANAINTPTYQSQAGQLARKLKAEEAKVAFASSPEGARLPGWKKSSVACLQKWRHCRR